ncbi:MAG: glgB 2 [Mucilaginibacter sp.]|nr:glgB 2 [Mucilaginibacter sp.]MDB5015653.1 glgB 2 [Mucilaginibacter sp.]
MNMRNLYLLLTGILLVGVTACKKTPAVNSGSGNVPGNPAGKDVPSGAGDGVTFINSGTSAIFNIYAPNKKSVTILGDFNNWTASSKYAMTNSVDGTRWWIQVDNLDASTEYAYEYLIDGNLKVADPYSHKILDSANDKYIPASVYPNIKAYPNGKGNGIVSDIQYNAPAYSWTTPSFTRPDPKNLVVYELLVRDFVATHSYKTLTDTLSYLSNMGVNAIELLPVNEFEGNDSWGYNSNFMFALDKYYGTPNVYKAFIDACHARGIAVIQDIVLEDQFGSSPMVQMYWNTAASAPASNSPWFDVTNMHPDAVGYQLNHQSAATQYFTKNVMKYWMQEYKIDGFRFDEAKGYTQTNSGNSESAWAAYDAARIATWENYNTYMKSIDPNFYVILEYFAGNQEESILANQGMMLWTNLSSSGEQATMGYPSNPSWDLSGLFYDGYGFTAPYNLVAYFESHDEERLQFKNEQYGNSAGTYSTKDLATGLKRDEMGAVFMFSSPGPKMLWEFGERGYDISVNDATTGGRLGDKPPHWEYMADPNRHHLYQVYAQMIKMKTKNPVFTSTHFSYNLGGYVKTIQLLDPTANVEVVGNFDVLPQPAAISFPSTGVWYDNMTGTSINVTSLPYNVTLMPGEYHLYSNTPLKQ